MIQIIISIIIVRMLALALMSKHSCTQVQLYNRGDCGCTLLGPWHTKLTSYNLRHLKPIVDCWYTNHKKTALSSICLISSHHAHSSQMLHSYFWSRITLIRTCKWHWGPVLFSCSDSLSSANQSGFHWRLCYGFNTLNWLKSHKWGVLLLPTVQDKP